jgi:uncharacterized membrane protein
VISALQGTIGIGSDRSPDQDVTHALRLIVEIAQRALSPGVNDPTTALYCLDRLEESLRRMAARDVPSPLRFDSEGRLRVLTEVATFEDLACPTLAAVARYALRDADVVSRLLDVIATLGRTTKPRAAAELGALRDDLRRESETQLQLSCDRDLVVGGASRPVTTASCQVEPGRNRPPGSSVSNL